ncbi:MAG: MerR family transcriptional regulator [Acidimicrobiales bacterium]
MGERSYLSIGDVLALLRDEFPDITISKIRFLESRGLLVPERTPSGYRKFYDHDVERLRWILRQQREHFLPLKVIKGRLEGAETASQPESLFDPAEQPPSELVTPARSNLSAVPLANGSAHPSTGGRTGELAPSPARVATIQRAADTSSDDERADEREIASARSTTTDPGVLRHRHLSTSAEVSSPSTAPSDPATLSGGGGGSRVVQTRQHAHSAVAGSGDEGRPTAQAGEAAPGAPAVPAATVPPNEPAPAGSAASAVSSTAPTTPRTSGETAAHEEAEGGTRAPVAAAGAGASGSAGAGSSGATGALSASAATRALAGANLTAGELAQASGLTLAQVEELESFGLIEGRSVAGVHCYDEDAVVVAGLASSFTRYGIEARHLKIFKHAAERQAGLYSQVVAPLLRQRNPEARARANDDLQKMADLGTSIMTYFTRSSLRDLTGG